MRRAWSKIISAFSERFWDLVSDHKTILAISGAVAAVAGATYEAKFGHSASSWWIVFVSTIWATGTSAVLITIFAGRDAVQNDRKQWNEWEPTILESPKPPPPSPRGAVTVTGIMVGCILLACLFLSQIAPSNKTEASPHQPDVVMPRPAPGKEDKVIDPKQKTTTSTRRHTATTSDDDKIQRGLAEDWAVTSSMQRQGPKDIEYSFSLHKNQGILTIAPAALRLYFDRKLDDSDRVSAIDPAYCNVRKGLNYVTIDQRSMFSGFSLGIPDSVSFRVSSVTDLRHRDLYKVFVP
jgi:hypothetical protein